MFRTISKACGRIGIPYVTFYAFSTENWKRSPEEVDALMRLFKDYLLEAQADISQAGNIRLKFIGSREGISDELLQLMDQVSGTPPPTPVLRCMWRSTTAAARRSYRR